MSTAPIRTAAKRRLYELVSQNLPAVQVTYSEPNAFASECVWLGNTTGEQRIAGLKAGRKSRFDDFSVEVHCLHFRSDSAETDVLDETVEGLWAAVDSVLADDPTLGALDSLIAAKVEQVAGPNGGPMVLAEKVAGYGSEIIASVYFTSRLT